MADINISDCEVKLYKHYLKDPYGIDYIPIIVIDVPLKYSEIVADVDGFKKINLQGDLNFSTNFGKSYIVPIWSYQPSSRNQPYVFLENYQDDKISVSEKTRYLSANRSYSVRYDCALLASNGSTGHNFDTNYSYIDDGGNATSICIMMVHTQDNVYMSNQWFRIYSELPPVSNVTPSSGKGGAESSKFSIWGNFLDGNYIISTDVAEWLLKGLKPYKVPDEDDPNPGGGDSKPGGGGGDGNIGGDTNPDDGLPTISALDSGLLTAYNPTVAELQSLGRFLWSDGFDVSTFKKLFNDPFDTLLGLSVVPVKPNTSGTKSIMFGNMDSGVSAPVVSNQWVPKDMGSVTLNEVWHGALDYAPSTGVTIYLPFIGMRQLNVNDVMGSTLHLIYKFDVLTGACVAQIYVNHSSQGNKDDGFSWTKDQGLVYEFIGQCSENIPLASQDFTNTIRAAIGGVSVAAGAAASVATGNPALGMAALTVGMANSGMQASTPTVERGGHLSGSASIMGYSQPFLIVERPHQCKPERYYALRGVPSQVYTKKLSKCTGFTQITANNNLHIAGASDSELAELQNLLVSGVYFPDKKR